MVELIAGSSRSISRRAWLVLSTLFASHAAFALFLNPIGASDNEVPELPALMLMGALFCQPVLFAIWAALGPGRAVLRIPLSLAASILICFAGVLTKWNVIVSRPRNAESFISDLVISIGCFAAILLIFLIVRKFTRWRIEWPAVISTTSNKSNQFGLKYLLGLTTLSCVLLVLGRLLAPEQLSADASSWRSTIAHTLSFGGLILLAMFPIFTLPLMVISRHVSIRALVVMPFAWAAFTWLAVEIGTAAQIGTRYEAVKAIVLLQCGATAIGVLSAIGIRVAGYRLFRLPSE